MKTSRSKHDPDYILIFTVFFLMLLGLVALSSASSEIGKSRFNDTYFYLKHQFVYGVLAGLLGFFIAYNFSLIHMRRLSVFLLLLTVVALVMVFTPLGFSSGGADRWLRVGGMTIQPSEILKLTFILYLATWLAADVRKRVNFIDGFIPFLFVCGMVAALLLLQPTTSTAVIILFAGLVMYFVSGGRLSFVGLAVLIGFMGLILVIYLTPYRLERGMSYFDPQRDMQGSGFQRNQALIALGSGGVFGVGYGDSISKFHYLPEPISDSIFAVIGEEFGFVGSVVIISVLLLLIFRAFRIAERAPDLFTKLLVTGIASMVAAQSFTNISAISGLLPLTGVPLPFISYGGTALAVLLTSMGIIANVSRYAR